MRNGKRLFIIVSIGMLFGIYLGYDFYKDYSKDERIMKKIQQREDYIVNMKEESVSIELFIKPEWIPFDSEEPMELEEVIESQYNTNIILQQVWNRGTDLHFRFHTTYHLDAQQGQFLHNMIFNHDGTVTSSATMNEYQFYDPDMNKIEVRSTGRGPNSDFSFEIEPHQYEQIKNGFYMIYSGMKLYEYSKR